MPKAEGFKFYNYTDQFIKCTITHKKINILDSRNQKLNFVH